MGTQAICAFCEDKETDENLINHTSNFAYFGSNKNLQNQESNLNIEENPLSFTFTPAGSNYSKIISDFGIIKWSNNSIFKGYFKNNIPNGWGIYFHHTNGSFQGEYYNDQPNGFGIFTHETEANYMGKKQGIGKYVFPNGYIYYGEWEQNLMNGYGLYLFDQNKIYIGEWLNGLKDGYGEIYGENHNYFFGFYRNNTQNGFFLSYNDKTGKIIVGYNANGKIDGIAKYFMPENEGRILILKNGHKIKEIKNLADLETSNEEIDIKYKKQLNKYFYMNREEIEEILKKKINNENYYEMLELLRSDEQ